MHSMERATGIEPALEAWEAPVLPLNYARIGQLLYRSRSLFRSHFRECSRAPEHRGQLHVSFVMLAGNAAVDDLQNG